MSINDEDEVHCLLIPKVFKRKIKALFDNRILAVPFWHFALSSTVLVIVC